MITVGCDEETARKIHTAYWRLNWAIKAIADAQFYKNINGKMWLFNPISKLYYPLKLTKDIFSTLVQGTASYLFDLWLGLVLRNHNGLIGQFHDEFIFEIQENEKAAFEKFVSDAVDQVNAMTGMNRELGVSIQFGKFYNEIH